MNSEETIQKLWIQTASSWQRKEAGGTPQK